MHASEPSPTRRTRPLLQAGLALVLAGASAAAPQTLLYSDDGDAGNDWFGQSARGAGDVNADGFDDWIVGAPEDDDNGFSSGMARVFSGLDGSVLYTFLGDSAGDRFGTSVSGAGDVNNDGFDDVIVGAPQDDNKASNGGTAQVFSGADGSLLHTFAFASADSFLGVSVSGAGDVDADGFDDVIAGASSANSAGGVQSGAAAVYSGQTGVVLHTLQGSSPFESFGNSVSGAGDVNSDGFDDVIVGAPLADPNGNSSGNARVFSGLDGSVLWNIDGGTPGARMGSSVGGAGYVNADGHADVIIGADGDDNGGVAAGSATVVSGLDGSTLHKFFGDSASDAFGNAVAGAGDVNADGFADLVVGSYRDDPGGANSGSVFVFSGLDGSTLITLGGSSPGGEFGFAVGPAGDVNGDGRDDIVVGTRFADNNGTNSGTADVYRLVADPQSYCTAGTSASGCQAILASSGTPSATATSGFVVRAANIEGNKDGVFFQGVNGRQANAWGNGTSLQCVIPPVQRLGLQAATGTNGSCDGVKTQDLTAAWTASPAKNPGAGAVVQVQLWFRDPQNSSNQTTSLSDALEFAVGP